MEWLNAAVSEPYYLFHLLAFFSYLPIRCSAALVLSPDVARLLLRREIQAVLAFLALAAVKLVREETWEAFIADSLFFSKVFLVVVTLAIDYHLALWYILIFLVIFTLTQQPAFQFLGIASKLTPLQLETVLNDGATSRFWLVEFRSSCSSSCIRASRCFAELSITYSNKNLSFAIVDLGLFPVVAENFGISLGNMAQLPTYILFENATEIARLPDVDLGVKISYPSITKTVAYIRAQAITDLFDALPPILVLLEDGAYFYLVLGASNAISWLINCMFELLHILQKRLLSRHFELDRLLLQYVNGK